MKVVKVPNVLFVRNRVLRGSYASFYLDLFRFFSAFTVLFFHTSKVTDIDTIHPKHWTIYEMVHMFTHWTSLGYQFVMAFFVLSGYFVGSSVIKQCYEDKWSWNHYLINRITRLWIVLIPALVFTSLWNLLQHHVCGAYIFPDVDMSWRTFVGNLFFLQDMYVPLFGHNGPLWSLSYEFWYYILFPCLVMLITKRTLLQKLLYLALVVAIVKLVGINVVEYFFIWMFGVVVALIKPWHSKSRTVRSISILLSAVFVYETTKWNPSASMSESHFISDSLVGISFAFLIYLLLSFNNERTDVPRAVRTFSTLAGFSYTLYLTHYPILDLLYALEQAKWWRYGNDFYHVGLLVDLFILVIAYIIGRFTEGYTDRLRGFVMGIFGGRKVTTTKITTAPTRR